MKLPQTLYITDPRQKFESLAWVHQLHENGVEGIVLSLNEVLFYEDHPEEHFLAYFHEKADQLKAICEALGMTLLVADNMQVAHFSNSDGIFLVTERPDLAALKKEEPKLMVGMEAKSLDLLHDPDADLADFLLFPEDKSMDDFMFKPKIPCYFKNEQTGFWSVEK